MTSFLGKYWDGPPLPMEKIVVDTASATETRKATAVEEAAATAKAQECQKIKDEAEAILAKALPELEDSLKVLSPAARPGLWPPLQPLGSSSIEHNTCMG